MFLVRNVFHAKPGNARALIEKFKKAAPYLEASGFAKNVRIMTDTVADFWTVVIEGETEDLNAYMNMAKNIGANKEYGEAMKGYIDLITGGYREVFLIEN